MNQILVDELHAKIETLEEEISQLKDFLEVRVTVPAEWCLLNQEIIAYRLLASRALLTRDRLRYALWGERDEPKHVNYRIAGVIAGLRRKLKPHGFKIKVIRSIGWMLERPGDRPQ